MDLTPEALIARLQAGKVYPQERVEAALNHFFRIENLSALREVALREVAEEVETKRRVSPFAPVREPLGTREDRPQAPPPSAQAIQERLLALVTPDPNSQRVVRRAARSAQRLDGELDLLYVRHPAASRTPASASSSRPCAGSPPCSARTCCSRRATTSPRSPPASPASAARPTC